MSETTPAPQTQAAPQRKAGVPVWRVGKPDAFLAAAVGTAREALNDIARPVEVGAHVAVKSEGERVATHLFESLLPGYRGWYWYVTVARVARAKTATVSEIGLVPSENAVLAPEWVPWSERVRPEDSATESEAAESGAAEADAGATDAAAAPPAAEGTDDGEGSPSVEDGAGVDAAEDEA